MHIGEGYYPVDPVRIHTLPNYITDIGFYVFENIFETVKGDLPRLTF